MTDYKKLYLKNYRLQKTKISRMKEMIKVNSQKSDIYLSKIKASQKIIDSIEQNIEQVDGGILTEILFLKYVCGKTLLEVSYCINYSPRQTQRLHSKALSLLRI